MDYRDFQDIIFFGSLVSNISDYELYHHNSIHNHLPAHPQYQIFAKTRMRTA